MCSKRAPLRRSRRCGRRRPWRRRASPVPRRSAASASSRKGAVMRRAVCRRPRQHTGAEQADAQQQPRQLARHACGTSMTATTAPAWHGPIRGRPRPAWRASAGAGRQFLARHVQRGHRRAAPFHGCAAISRAAASPMRAACRARDRSPSRARAASGRAVSVCSSAPSRSSIGGPQGATQPSSPGAFTGTSASWWAAAHQHEAAGAARAAGAHRRAPRRSGRWPPAASPRRCGRAGRNRCPARRPRWRRCVRHGAPAARRAWCGRPDSAAARNAASAASAAAASVSTCAPLLEQ